MDGGVGGAFRLEGGSEAVNGRVEIAPVDCMFLDEVVEELIPRAYAGDPIGGVLRVGVTWRFSIPLRLVYGSACP